MRREIIEGIAWMIITSVVVGVYYAREEIKKRIRQWNSQAVKKFSITLEADEIKEAVKRFLSIQYPECKIPEAGYCYKSQVYGEVEHVEMEVEWIEELND